MSGPKEFPAIRGDRIRRFKAPVEKRGAVVYCRVSTKDQLDGFSIETQESACRAYCKQRGYTVEAVFHEARSAKNTERPQFQAMLKQCLDPRSKIGAVVVYAVSRFARSAMDHLNVRRALQAQNVRLLSVSEQFDDRTASGRWHENTLSVNAQYDNDQRSERTKDGMMTALCAGKWCHKAPIGYVNSEAPGGLSVDPGRANLVRTAFELYASQQYSKKAVLDLVTESGLRTPKSNKRLSQQTFDKMLRNPLYAGWITSAWGISSQGQFEPIIPLELFNAVQDWLAGKSAVTRQTRSRENADFPLRVFVRCAECGRGLTGSFSTGRRGKRYPYYCCPKRGCRAVKFGRDILHHEFHQLLYHLHPEEGFIPLFQAAVRDVWKQKHVDHEQRLQQAKQRISVLEKRNQQIVDAFLEGTFDKATYETQREKVGTALDEARAQQSEELIGAEQVECLLEFAEWMLERIAGIWNSASLPKQLRIQQALFPGGLTVTKDGFGTPLRPLFFKQFQAIPVEETSLASPGGFEPPLPP